jgi:(2R)-sulfolactate sulfo-lyase subunit alpha
MQLIMPIWQDLLTPSGVPPNLFFANRRGLTTEVIVIQPASSPPSGGPAFLAHHRGDDVAVAVRDAEPGDASGAYLESGDRFEIAIRAPIPLGHKVALRDLAENEQVTEYGVLIGLARCPVAAGDLVHTHNLRSARWRSSV